MRKRHRITLVDGSQLQVLEGEPEPDAEVEVPRGRISRDQGGLVIHWHSPTYVGRKTSIPWSSVLRLDSDEEA